MATAMGEAEHEALAATHQDEEADYEALQPNTGYDDVGLISRRLRELQEMSELGRLFNMILDLKVDLAEWASAIVANGSRDPFGRPAGYAYTRVRWPSGGLLEDDASTWTLTKLTLGDDGARVSFLPYTREEALAALSPGGCAQDREQLTMVDGVRLLSARPGPDGHPRHELSSIDPMDAMQDLASRPSLLTAHVAARPDLESEKIAHAFLDTRPAGEPWPTASLKSRSLRLIHPHETVGPCINW